MFIEISSLTKEYGAGESRIKALDDVSVSIEKGKICIVAGSSGSGKSTLLNCIGGLETVNSGTVVVDGTDITKLKKKELTEYRRNSVGFVFQFYNLIPDLTVAENVDLCRYLSGNAFERDEVLKTLGIYEKRDAFPNTLSGGEQQRCAIARALVKNPQLILCDEPTGALDSKTARDMLCLLEKVNSSFGTTILMVTHNPAILNMGHQIITLQDGKITDTFMNINRTCAENLEGI